MNEAKQRKEQQLIDIENSIQGENNRLEAAESLIKEGNKTLTEIINAPGKINKCALMKAQFVLTTGIDRKLSQKYVNYKVENVTYKKIAKIYVHIFLIK